MNTLHSARHHLHPQSSGGQRGVALILSLILLAVMTTFAVLGVRLITGEERQVAYALDRTIALQAADAGLREVEELIELTKPQPAGATCDDFVDGLKTVKVCPIPVPANTPRWNDPLSVWTTASQVGTASLALTPQYIAEYLGDTFPCTLDPSSTAAASCLRYRVTARAGAAGRARVTVQSIYSPQ
jgi:type IV pilus assembly protein PilX